MFITNTKRYAFTGFSLTLLAFLLLTLSGCDTTSDPRQHYQPTGSWQGTIGADQVRGIIAPDRTFHLAIVDAGGNSVGEYVGRIYDIDTENIGSMTLTRLHTTENPRAPRLISFKLSADRLYSLDGLRLTRTAEANGPAVPGAVAGHWSLLAADNLTDVVVNTDGTLSGSDGINCNYSGALQLLTPSWNIYFLEITLAEIPGGTCNVSDYSGLAMVLSPENERRRLWLAANNQIRDGVKTFLGEWAETINIPPVARMTILGDRTSTGPESSVLVKAGAAVALDAQGSSDANNDPLTYTWSGTAPDGFTPLNILGTGSAATFVPLVFGLHTINLTVSDGIAANTLTRQLSVVETPNRFVDCTNGTILDTRTNLLWLQNAGCDVLNLEETVDGPQWGVSHALALERVGTLAAGVCELGDTSVAGDWRLPTLTDFGYIVPESQWSSEGNIFGNVGAMNPDPQRALRYYWTADRDLAAEFNWFFVDVNYVAPADWSGSYFENTRTAVWPVRTFRADETCP